VSTEAVLVLLQVRIENGAEKETYMSQNSLRVVRYICDEYYKRRIERILPFSQCATWSENMWSGDNCTTVESVTLNSQMYLVCRCSVLGYYT
jgi:hypothetical protein